VVAWLPFTFILPDLAVGAQIPCSLLETLSRDFGIRRLVDLRAEDKDDVELCRSHGLLLLHLPIDDMCALPNNVLDEGVRWCRQGMDAGEKVLVHCQHGVGRSALLALCVLVSLGYEAREALEHAKERRWQISPNVEQLGALLSWNAEWRRREGLKAEKTSVQDLTSIAWRHLVA
jgi:protein-tyrosine phosphatase